MLAVGLTGNYGTGKSTVLRMFSDLGASTVSADDLVGEALGTPEVTRRVAELLGNGVLGASGAIDREKTAELIFADPGSRAGLEALLHPIVFKRIDEWLSGIGHGVAVVEVPLLFEGGYEGRFSIVIVVRADEETALGRLEKKGVSRDKALVRLKSQGDIDEKARRADYVIENSGDEEDTRAQVERIYGELKWKS